jgi:hypothetical protein
MTGSIFKRKLRTGVSWGYVFFGGWDENGKRIQVFKSGFTTKDAASRGVRAAIDEYEEQHGKVSREVGPQGRRVWAYSFDSLNESGFETKSEAEEALCKAIERRAADEQKQREDTAQAAVDAAGPPFAQYFAYWLREHASRRCAPKTLERYSDIGVYLIRELGEVRLNEMTTAKISGGHPSLARSWWSEHKSRTGRASARAQDRTAHGIAFVHRALRRRPVGGTYDPASNGEPPRVAAQVDEKKTRRARRSQASNAV